jgi:hypothetical protein
MLPNGTFDLENEMKKANKTSLPQHDIDGGVVVVPVNVMMYLIKRAILILLAFPIHIHRNE